MLGKIAAQRTIRGASPLSPIRMHSRLLSVPLVLLASSGVLCAQAEVRAFSGAAGGFVDLSHHLEGDRVLVLGTLTKVRDGKRERLRENTDLGGGGTSVQVAGTVFYSR